MKNKWKMSFLILMGINLLTAIILFSLIVSPASSPDIPAKKGSNRDYVSFHVKSNKYDLNRLINHYLEQEVEDSPIDYRVVLNDEVELYGILPVFSDKINMKLTFEPEAIKNGDLVLKQKSMSIGSLRVPISYVLSFIKENYKLPRGVEIRPSDKLIYVHMQELKLKSDMKIEAEQFDLKKNKISFTILVPVK
ncbi:YpmS family protein [Neobacillus sp. LXY-1]|uniref:YpmS family protein n=1 Tax=Neobacillus sp. LXY-1 TaxID=3379133 RepID=UPI003EE0DBB6